MKSLVGTLIVAGSFAIIANRTLAADDRIDVSRIVDKTTAESLLGEAVKTPAPRNFDGKDGYYSKCNYYSANSGKKLIIRLYQAAAGGDPQKDLELVSESTGAMRSISGLGDKARISSGAESGLPSRVVMLYVVKGNSLVTVGLGGMDDETLAAEKARGIAQKILEHL